MTDRHGGERARAFDGEPTLFPELPYHLRERADHFLADAAVQGFVEDATSVKDRGRRTACAEAFGSRTDDWRRHAAAIKQHTLDHLDHYLALFIDRAESAGASVHVAKDAEEANRIAVDIATGHGAKLCVKSKSMVTEETHLLGAFERAGIETVETDLGEFIIQLDRDAPSHIVMPMIHKDRTAVARAFERELGSAYTEDPAELTAIARAHLRKEFLRADLGVTGGNFLLAESGTLVICTNEGNGRFCATTPAHQIAMVGIEKVIPDLERLAPFIKLLARSATGQPLTVYTQFLTGPRREREKDGPETLDIILVDAGRTAILANEEYRAALRCIRCGACQNACPVYRKATGHAYGSVYGGPIGAVITPLLKGLENYPDLPGASSLCGACREACPVDIDLPGMLISLRRDLAVRRPLPFSKRLLLRAMRWSFATPGRMRWAQWGFRWFARAMGDGESIAHLPGPGKAWTRERNFPLPAAETFRARWRRVRKEGSP